VEGAKSVQETLLSTFSIETLFVTEDFLNQHINLIEKRLREDRIVRVKEQELTAIGTLQTNNAALALVSMRENTPLVIHEEYALALDDVRDPGNLGTILRIADWYGIRKMICSQETAELYNPKVISASMGSFLRIQVYYTDLPTYFQQNSVPVYGAVLDGENVHQTRFPGKGIILLGNESKGIHSSLFPFLQKRIRIPRYGEAESLNVAIATAVICDNIRRFSDSAHAGGNL
jgi:TrmH family RNA methyltransferase